MESIDGVQSNIEKIAELFPNCITEALDTEKSTPDHPVYKKAINLKLLNQMLSDQVLEGDEAYEMTWVGKKAAIVEANKPIIKTLRPCPEESVNWDTTENLYIEGDNLEVLKLLQESYLGKVKMIYIDPPYNTGHDFIYPDSYKLSEEAYNDGINYLDEEGNINFHKENQEGAPKFHSDWCSMIYPRLLLSKNLLDNDGIIFISIDNNEMSQLKLICDEVFGNSNFISCLAIENNPKGRKNSAFISESFEYCLIYAKNKKNIYDLLSSKGIKKFFNGIPIEEDQRKTLFDKYGEFKQSKRQVSGLNKSNALCKESKKERCFTIYYSHDADSMEILDEYDSKLDEWVQTEKGKLLEEKGYTRYCCRNSRNNKPAIPLYSKSKIQELFQNHSLYFKEDGTIYEKDRDNTQQINSFIGNKKYNLDLMTESATAKMEKLLGKKGIFTNSKSLDFMQMLIGLYPSDNFTILDFFAGSSTTAHALMLKNLSDGGKRRFIMIQVPESCDKASVAYKSGYSTISEIGIDRIKKATTQIKNNNPLEANTCDLGFRVFKLDSSNMKDIYFHPNDLSQGMLFNLESNLKEDRNDLDLFFGCILDWGLPLSLPYSTEIINDIKIHNYNNGDLIACFEEDVSEELVKEIASRQPMRAVFRDSSFCNSPDKINVFEIFKKYMPEDADDITRRVKVI